MADAIDDDTCAAVISLWKASNALAALFVRPVQREPVRSPDGSPVPAPYATVASEFASRELAGASGGWHDHRAVTLTAWGPEADVRLALSAVLDVFNRSAALTYPSTDPVTGLPRFVRWWPANGGEVAPEKEPRQGRQIWRAVVTADVWSIRLQ